MYNKYRFDIYDFMYKITHVRKSANTPICKYNEMSRTAKIYLSRHYALQCGHGNPKLSSICSQVPSSCLS